MAHFKKIRFVTAASLLLFFSACHSDKGSPANNLPGINSDTTTSARTVSVIISSIPFPSSILDSLSNLNIKFRNDLLDPVTNISLYSESNSQSANLGLFGADLAYVISFEQFQSVGNYMKATKYLADNLGVPLAFTETVVERCEKNQNNKDSLAGIVLQSYNVIDHTLKHAQRDASEVLVLAGGWIEGVYLTTQSLDSVPQGTRRRRLYHILLDQKQYAGRLLDLLNEVKPSSAYCNALIAPMQEIKTAFDAISSESEFNDTNLQILAGKVKDMRASLVNKGNS